MRTRRRQLRGCMSSWSPRPGESTIGRMDARDVQSFVDREWSLVQASKRMYWATVFQRDGWRTVWDAAQALLAHTRAVQPDFPNKAARRADLADHQRFRARLDRAA